jgi:uncharacterized protein DUF1707/cell wall-active antibiotic response 4TMS protein YvqF
MARLTVAGGAEVPCADVVEPLLASDADRDIALALLRQASVDGRLTLDDLAERAELVHVARTRDDVAAATAGLAPAVPAPDEGAEVHRAILSSLVREGRWRLAPRNRFSAVLGTVRLDLREAILPGPEVAIEVRAVLGSVELLVSEGVQVHVTGGAPLSSQDLRVQGTSREGAPLIRIHYTGALGSLAVRSRPRLVDRVKDIAGR